MITSTWVLFIKTQIKITKLIKCLLCPFGEKHSDLKQTSQEIPPGGDDAPTQRYEFLSGCQECHLMAFLGHQSLGQTWAAGDRFFCVMKLPLTGSHFSCTFQNNLAN